MAERNPALLMAPGHAGVVPLYGGLSAFVARGQEPGPIVWAWAARGERDPSHAQALGELRDRLSPQRLRGAVGLLIDGPPPPLGNESYPFAAAVRALAAGAEAVVLLACPPLGFEATPHVALQLSSTQARKVARALGARFVAPEGAMLPLNRALLGPTAVTWIDGESERLSRSVVDRAAAALGSLLGKLGMSDDPPRSPAVRVVLKTVTPVEAIGEGLVEPVVAPGALVQKGQPVAYAGPPGTRTRRALRAPVQGVVLWLRSGQVSSGAVLGIGRLHRSLARLTATRAAEHTGDSFDLGWCEHVALPELGVTLRAKIDTGARSCALHVTAMREVAFDDDGHVLLDLSVSDERGRPRVVRAAVLEYTHVKDSGGHTERRPVIETLLQLGGRAWRVRVTLTDRGDMRFPMLVGRTALWPEMRVHPTRRYLAGRSS